MAFKHCSSFAIDSDIESESESRLTSFPSFCKPPSEVAVLFDLNLSRCPFLGQVVDLDLLLCTVYKLEHAVLFLCHILTQRPMTDRKIELSHGRCFGWQQLLATSIKILISHENKKWLVSAQNLQSIKTLLTLELNQYSKSSGMFSRNFSSSKPVTASSDCRWLGNALSFVLALPNSTSRAGEWPQERGCWLCPLNFRLPCGTAFGEIARYQAGAQTWTQTWTLPPDQQVVKVL